MDVFVMLTLLSSVSVSNHHLLSSSVIIMFITNSSMDVPHACINHIDGWMDRQRHCADAEGGRRPETGRFDHPATTVSS